MSKTMIKVTQVRSIHGRLKKHQACVAGLGLRRIGHTVEVEDTPSVRGMTNKVNYLVRVEGESNVGRNAFKQLKACARREARCEARGTRYRLGCG